MISGRYKYNSRPTIHLNKIQIKAKDIVENNIKTGKSKFETIYCPICSSNKFDLLSEKDRYCLKNDTVICKKCGLVLTNPRMTQSSHNEFYDTEYRKLYVGTKKNTKSFFETQFYNAKGIFNFIQTTYPKLDFNKLNVLEIGCGAGGILHFFKNKGCNVLGVDLGGEYIQYGKNNHKLNLIKGYFENAPKDFTPNIIIYSHVLEHILDINSELNQIKKLCSQDTIVYIEVPGIKNIHNSYKMDALRYFQNAHTFNFPLTSLTNLFEKNGFKSIRSNEYIRSIFLIHKN